MLDGEKGLRMADLKPGRRAFLGRGCACCLGALTWPIAAESASDRSADGQPQALELGAQPMTRIDKTVWVRRLAPGLWLHTTTGQIEPGFYYPANGLVLERPQGSLLIDTGYTPGQAETLLAWSGRVLKRPITEAIATHLRNDRTGGIDGLRRHGVRTLAHPATCALAKAHGVLEPQPIADFQGDAHRLDDDCELYFPGAGHTCDNIVAGLPQPRVLFGGCFLKSVTSSNLGNIADAVVDDWAGSLERARTRYPDAILAVPGHGTISGDAFARTHALLAAPA